MARFLGYDPGGDGKHGVAWLDVTDGGDVTASEAACVETAAHALAWLSTHEAQSARGIGVDTLTEWNLGSAGWRPADVWLQAQYREAHASVASPNSLYGAMSLNGMAVLIRLLEDCPDLVVSETHPKVLYLALSKKRYAWKTATQEMNEWCATTLGCVVNCVHDHEWDALLSAWACAQGVLGRWTRDLHALPDPDGHAVRPVGPTRYFWP